MLKCVLECVAILVRSKRMCCTHTTCVYSSAYLYIAGVAYKWCVWCTLHIYIWCVCYIFMVCVLHPAYLYIVRVLHINGVCGVYVASNSIPKLLCARCKQMMCVCVCCILQIYIWCVCCIQVHHPATPFNLQHFSATHCDTLSHVLNPPPSHPCIVLPP